MAAPSAKSNRTALPAASLDELSQAMTSQAAGQILETFPTLSRAQRAANVNVFRRRMLPPAKRGRPPNKIITKAAELWRRGLRGAALLEACIPGFQTMGAWRRKFESRRLLEALRVRRRRELKEASPTAVQNRTGI